MVAIIDPVTLPNDAINLAFNNFDYFKKGNITAEGLFKVLGSFLILN